MTKPPRTPPHSDIDGVDEDRRHNVDAANEAGQDSADLEREKKESIGRPDNDNSPGSADDRSR